MSCNKIKSLDPLRFIPTPETVARHLNEAEQITTRLRVLLRVAREIWQVKEDATCRCRGEADHAP